MKATTLDAQQLESDLRSWLNQQASSLGGNFAAIKPDHYRPWHWPIHPVSFNFHIPASEWHGVAAFTEGDESFEVKVARTPWGVFGRCEQLRAEAKGNSVEEMLAELRKICKPLFDRQVQIGSLLGLTERYEGSIRELKPAQKLRLLFASDRAIAHDAQNEIETGGDLCAYGPALITILNESRHPNRRTAQWLVLDLYEDLQSYCPTPESERAAVDAIRNLMWSAEDDYARTIYKAGVVLGGHVCTEHSADTIIDLMSSPSRIARRSAMHASFHLCEWMPAKRHKVLETLHMAAERDAELLLRTYCQGLARDIEREVIDHIAEPIFPDEP